MKFRLELKDAFKGYTLDQDKVVPPEETVQRFREKLKRLELDILQGTERIDSGRLDIPVYFSRCGRDAAAVTGTKKQMGKGATPQQAEASAVMELAERFSFFSFYRNPAHFFTRTYREITDPCISFDMIARSVHDDSAELAVSQEIFADLSLEWTWGYNLTRGEPVLVPFDWFYTINEFNGPSAGNCVEEALSQGICEIVERHVSSLVSHRQLSVPGIDPGSATDPKVQEMLGKYRNAGVDLYVSDFTLDTGIPTVGVLAHDRATFPQLSEIVWTAGTTPDPQKALSRALTEVAQLAGDFNSGANYVASGLPKPTSLEAVPYVTQPAHRVSITSLPDLSSDNIKTEVLNLVQSLKQRDLEVIVIDTAHPQLGIPAFYTIVPGAHFRERSLGTSVGMFAAKITAERQQSETALAQLAKIDRILPEKYYVQFYRGSCRLALGDPEAALNHFKRALELGPTRQDTPSIYSYMGVCLKDMGRYRQALTALEKGETFDSERTDIYNLKGFCYFKLKEHTKAIECFKRVLEIDPGSAIDHANIASNYRDLGETAKATHYYRLALALDPGIDFARENLAKLDPGADKGDA